MSPGAAERERAASRALVLLSGGIDSTVVLHEMLRRGHEVEALLLRHPGQPSGERRAARAVATAAGVRLHEVDLPFMDLPPDGPAGFVPHRNIVFYAVAAHVAHRIGAAVLAGGHNAEDGDEFADARRGFFERLLPALEAGSGGRPLSIVLPLIGLPKRGVVAMGRRMGVPLGATWSCYRRLRRHCGRCVACRERTASLA